MDLVESIKMAGTTLMANKLRSSLTMLGIIIGNASVIAMIGIGEGAQSFVKDQVNSLGTNVLFIIPGNPDAQRRPVMQPPTLVKADADAIASQVPTVQEVAPALTGSEIVSYRSNNSTASLIGATPSYLIVRNFDVAKGRFITKEDLKRQTNIAVLGSEIAEILFGKEDPVGHSIRIKNTSLQVVGVMQPKGAAFGDNQDLNIFLPLTTMSNRIAGRSSPYGMRVSFISVSVKDESMMTAAQFQIENPLKWVVQCCC